MINVEEKLLVNILYRSESEILNDIDLDNVNFEKLITLASGHLMLPALFFNIEKKNISYLFPQDFIEYIKYIYTLNKARNTVLLAEAKELSELLFKNNINHIFLKGTALLLSDVFEDIGERMIGDIDFIFQYKDEKKIKNVLGNNNTSLQSLSLWHFFRPKHLSRQVLENKIIAIEPHLELLEAKYRFTFNSKNLINDFNEGLTVFKTPNKSFLFDHCVYNFQINDSGFVNKKHNHRSIYDIYMLNHKNSLTIKNITKDIYVKHFFLTIAKFKIFDLKIKSSFWSLTHDKIFRSLIFLFIKFLIIIDKLSNKFSIIIQLFFNKKLRKSFFDKISYHDNIKNLLNHIYGWLKA